MIESTLYYFGTDNPVLPGDRIKIMRLLRSTVCATVTYIPGVSKFDSNNGNDQWSYKIDNGDYYVIGYDPSNKHFASKRVSLISRADKESFDKYKSFVAPPEFESNASISSELIWLFAVAVAIFLVLFGLKVVLN